MKVKLRHILVILFIFICVVSIVRADSLNLRNYDKDPNLALAMQYDRGETTDSKMADREKAEKYYLEYLKRDLPSFQKARIYFRLGNLYTVASDPKNGIAPDYEKGQKYIEKVLELEPERIDRVTIGARTLLASSPAIPAGERVKKRIDIYEWLCSLDEDKFKENWLPISPDQKEVVPVALQQFRNLIPSLKNTEAINIVACLKFQPDKGQILHDIIERFPGDEIAELAQEELKKSVSIFQGSDLQASELSSLLGIYVWKIDVSLPDNTEKVNFHLEMKEKGKPDVKQFGGGCTTFVSPENTGEMLIAIIPLDGTISNSEKVRVVLDAFGTTSSSIAENPMIKLGIGSDRIPKKAGEGTFSLLGGYKGDTISSPISETADVIISLKIEPQ